MSILLKPLRVLFLLFPLSLAAAEDHLLVQFSKSENLNAAKRSLEDRGFEVLREIPQIQTIVVRQTLASISTGALSRSEGIVRIEENFKLRAFNKPNDIFLKRQSSLRNGLQIEGAWGRQTGSSDVIVAVIDTGIYKEHEDLKSRLWVNPKEIPGNGIDEDQNGYIDDIHGWNYVNDSNDTSDDNSHGTHIAGIIGAEGNNQLGIAGINWNVTLMPLKFLDAQGTGDLMDAISAIIYAADNGARVINASWGGDQGSDLLEIAIEYAGAKGVLFVTAAGNDGKDLLSHQVYPASYALENAVTVGASTDGRGIAGFTNFGATKVHLSAPGVDVYSTLLGAKEYGFLSGTSMATPMVAGVAALMLAHRPELTVIELKNALLNAVDFSSYWQNNNATDGVLNASRALEQLDGKVELWPRFLRIPVGGVQPMSFFGGSPPFTWKLSDPKRASIDESGRLVALSAGEVTVFVQDSLGQTGQTRIKILGEAGGGCGSGASQAQSGVILFLSLFPLVFALILRFLLRRRSFYS